MVRFRRCHRSVLGFIAATGFSIGCPTPEAMAAVDIALVSGGFRRSIPVKQVEHLAETGEAIGLLEDLLEISGQKPEEVSKLLNQKLELPVVLTSRLINTRIGDAIVRRVAKIIYPIYAPSPGQRPRHPRRCHQWIAGERQPDGYRFPEVVPQSGDGCEIFQHCLQSSRKHSPSPDLCSSSQTLRWTV